MGALLQAECLACGHNVELLAGVGFAGIELEPRTCRDCAEIVCVAVDDRLHRPDPLPDLKQCPVCGGKDLQPIPKVPDGDEANSSVPSFRCPRCDASMNVYSSGVWD
jgi:hypothetical protein